MTMLKIKNDPDCKLCRGVMTAELQMLGGYLLQSQSVNICECCMIETEDGKYVPYHEFIKGMRVLDLKVSSTGEVNLNRDCFPKKTITQKYNERLKKIEDKVSIEDGVWVDTSEPLSTGDVVTACPTCGNVRKARLEENICCSRDLSRCTRPIGLAIDVDNENNWAKVKPYPGLLACAVCQGMLQETKEGFSPILCEGCKEKMKLVGHVEENNTLKIGPKERVWKPCSTPIPIGQPVVACPQCGYFFPVRECEDSNDLLPIFEWSEKCLYCGKSLFSSELGSIAFTIAYRNIDGVKEIQVTYVPEKYPKTIGDHEFHLFQAKQYLEKWALRNNRPMKLKEIIDYFDKDNITIADLTVSGFENLAESDYPQVTTLFALLRGLWTGSSRIGTLYLTRDEDGTLVLKFPLRLKANDSEFVDLKDTIENVRLELE